MLSPLADVVGTYNCLLQGHYLATTATQAFVLVGAGDAIAQTIELRSCPESPAPMRCYDQHCVVVDTIDACPAAFDAARCLRMATLGVFIGGLGTATWLRFLEEWLPGNGDPQLVVAKACLDACIWAPIANAGYLVLTPLLEGKDAEFVRAMLAEQLGPVMRTELSTFFPYNLVSFSLVPPLLRPFTTGFVSMCFAVYMSWATHSFDEMRSPDRS